MSTISSTGSSPSPTASLSSATGSARPAEETHWSAIPARRHAASSSRAASRRALPGGARASQQEVRATAVSLRASAADVADAPCRSLCTQSQRTAGARSSSDSLAARWFTSDLDARIEIMSFPPVSPTLAAARATLTALFGRWRACCTHCTWCYENDARRFARLCIVRRSAAPCCISSLLRPGAACIKTRHLILIRSRRS